MPAQILLFVNRICLHPCVYGLGTAGLCLICRIIPLAAQQLQPALGVCVAAPHMAWDGTGHNLGIKLPKELPGTPIP